MSNEKPTGAKLAAIMHGVGDSKLAKQARNPFGLQGQERHLFTTRMKQYLRYHNFQTPAEIDLLALACWAYVRLVEAVNVLNADPDATVALRAAKEYQIMFRQALKDLGISYTPKAQKRKDEISKEDIDIASRIAELGQ